MTRKLSKKKSVRGDRLRRGAPDRKGTDESTDASIDDLIVIGASAGGYRAIREVIRELSTDIPAAIVLVLHRAPAPPQVGDFGLEQWIETTTHIPVVTVRSGDRLRRGAVYVVPAGMAVSLKGKYILQVTTPEKGAGANVTINTLFESAAREYGSRLIGVILTGLLRDGTAGLQAVHDAGGLTIVQDPAGAEYPDMPSNAMKDLPVTFCLELADIGPALDLLVRRNTELETGLAASVRLLKERVALLARLIGQSQRNPGTAQFLSTEMVGLEVELRSLEALVAKTLLNRK